MLYKLLLAGIINLFFFLGVYFLLQHNIVYSNTLGVISDNYQSSGDWNNPDIKKVKKPYIAITNEGFEKWDASFYKCIKDGMYSTNGCYDKVKGAFFPLFPVAWRLFSFNSIGISLFNYFIFILSVALLVNHYLKTTNSNKLLIYSILISLPSIVIYCIPYTEALFLFFMTLAVLGLEKKKYYLYFVSTLLMSMVRPATAFVLLAFLAVELINFVGSKDAKAFVKNCFSKALPFLIGYFLAIFIQYNYSHSWTMFRDAGTHWSGGWIQKITTISDWSVEGFGMNSFAVFFVCIPALIYLLYTVTRTVTGKEVYSTDRLQQNERYIFLVSLAYLSGMLVYTLLTSGGNLHSFFRFTLDSPLFYITMLFLLNHLSSLNRSTMPLLFLVPLCLLIIFFFSTSCGGNKFDFAYTGMCLYILTLFFLLFRERLQFRTQIVIAIVLILFSTVWNTYLLNMFFNEAWIFT
jgi:hypothetical protein